MLNNQDRQSVINQLRNEFPEVVANLQHCYECELEDLTDKDLFYALSKNLNRR